MDYFKDEPWNAVDINLYTLIEFEKPHVGKVWVPVLKTEDERLRKTISDPRIYGAIIDSKWKAWEAERHNRIAQYRLTHPYNAASDFFANPVPEPPTSSSSQAESDTECSTFDTFANPITEHSSFAESQAEGYSPFEVDETLTQASTSSASSRRGKKRAYAGTTEAADVFDWTDKAIKCMLAIRLSENQKFSNSTEAQSTLWRNVAIKMKEHGYTLDGPTASMKFRNMQKTYKVNKLRQSKTGQGADCVNWPYFEQFEAICGKQAKFTIPVETLGGSLPTDETNEQDPVEQESNEAIPNLKRGLTLPAYRKAKVGLATAKLELMERHNKDKLQLERERTEALKASEQSKLELLRSYFDKNQK